MSRLAVNVELVRINGRPSELNRPIDDIRKSIEKIANDTYTAYQIFVRTGSVNAGKQYDIASKELKKMSASLIDVSDQMFDMQMQIAEFEDKLHAFELESSDTIYPKCPDIKPISETETSHHFQFDKSQMIRLHGGLLQYVEQTRNNNTDLLGKSEDIGSIWHDPQYDVFKSFMIEVHSSVSTFCNVMNDYADALRSAIDKM